jgi:uncharacterized protein YbcI
MPGTSSADPARGDPVSGGRLAAAISTAVVHVVAEYTGRGPTKARTTIDGTTIVVILQESMTRAERSLAKDGKGNEVLDLRRSFQETMRPELVAIVEGLTSGTVTAFMSANHLDPDVAAEVFLMDSAIGAAPA